MHCAQKDPQSFSYLIPEFHLKVLRTRRRGTYQVKDIANMNQGPLPVVMNDGKMHADKGSPEVRCATHGSGLDKRKYSVQLTIFAARKPRVKPLVIFWAKRLRIKSKEQDALDRRVQVLFQEKALSAEPVMLDWISQQWNNCSIKPPTNGSSGKILISDVHRAQQTGKVKCILKKKNKTNLINVPPGCASRVKPLDVVFNKPFKDIIRQLFEQHIDENLVNYNEGKITASQRRVLITKWVGTAWSKMSKKEDTISRNFK